MKRNKKRFLAVFGVLLMIAFIVPSTMKNFGDRSTYAYGTMGDDKITYGEYEEARRDLATLQHYDFYPLALLDGEYRPTRPGQSGVVAKMLSENPETYVLLQREAKAAGIQPSAVEVAELYRDTLAIHATEPAKVESFKGTIERFLLVSGNYHRMTGLLKVTTPLMRAQIAQSQQMTLNIIEFAASDSLAATPAPTPEQIKANYDQYATIPVTTEFRGLPTTQPVQFGYQLPDRARLQYLELTQDALVSAVVKSFTPAELYDLDLIAVGYYSANPTQFIAPAPATAPTTLPATTGPSTNPATNPSTQPAATMPATTAPTVAQDAATQPTTSQPSTTQSATTRPVIKPFAEVRDDIRRRLLLGELSPPDLSVSETARLKTFVTQTNVKSEALRQKLRKMLQDDYRAQRGIAGAAPATQPVIATQPVAVTQPAAATQPALATQTAPTTRPFIAIDSPIYLEQMASEFEQSSGARPRVRAIAGNWLAELIQSSVGPASVYLLTDVWHTRTELDQAPGIGSSFAIEGRFAEIVTQHAVEEPTPAPLTLGPIVPATKATVPTSTAPSATAPSSTVPTTLPTTSPTSTPAAGPSTKPARSNLALYEPSPLLKDSENNTYFFRLTGFEGSRTPSFEEARPRIEEKLKLAAAYEVAKKEAQKFKDASAPAAANLANLTGGTPLNAELLGKKVAVAGPIMPMRPSPELKGYTLPDDQMSRQMFQWQVGPLLRKATADQPHPSMVIEMAGQQKVLVVEVRSIERFWTSADDYRLQHRVSNDLIRQQLPVMLAWFDSKAIIARTKFTPTGK